MNALDRPRGLGYWAVDAAAGYTDEHPHRGVDIKAWLGDPIFIGAVQIGITGQTGKAQGPHVHVQAGRDEEAQQTIDPTPYIGEPGKVVKVGFASEWGNYVCVKVGAVYVYYCHMSKTLTTVGTVIGEESMGLTKPEVAQFYQAATLGGVAPQDHLDFWEGHDAGEYGRYLLTDGSIQGLQKNYKDAMNQPQPAAAKSDADQKLQAIREALGIK